jgi:uncharacterized YccA/Bax inhibitor family protein
MSNPVFNNSPYFGEPQQGRGAPARPMVPPPAVSAQQVQQLEETFQAPSAAPVHTGRMTYDDVIVRSGGLIAIVMATAAVSWFLFPGNMLVVVGGAVGGLVLGLVNAFRREPSPALITGYAAFQGLFLGGISAVFEAQWPGIVLQAVLATFTTFIATLLLFTSGKVRVTPKFTRIVLVALVGYLIYSLVNVGIMMFGVTGTAWGLNDGVDIMGIPLGVVVGLAAVVLAAACLIMDFDAVKVGVERGVPARFAWQAAFGLLVTLIWLYLEFLRLIAIFRD